MVGSSEMLAAAMTAGRSDCCLAEMWVKRKVGWMADTRDCCLVEPMADELDMWWVAMMAAKSDQQ